jgi:predicted RNase H-like HicB family nuclease
LPLSSRVARIDYVLSADYGCLVKVRDIFSTGRSQEFVEKNMREAIAFHLDGLREEGQHVPEPKSYSAYVELPA